MSEILSRFGCDSYLTDLEAVHDYLHQWAREQRDLNNINVIEPDTPQNIKKIQKLNSNKTMDSSGKKSTGTEDSPLFGCQPNT